MGREITLFSDYKNSENTVTNYCGLILKMLYEENPNNLEEVLASLIEGNVNITIGPQFNQQLKKKKSVPDLAITQKAFSIFFENKLTDWFYSEQIQKHIEGFQDTDHTKILFLISNFEYDETIERFEKDISEANRKNTILQPITYEDFVGSIETVNTSEHFKRFLEEFKSYLDRNGYLPKWKYLLDVVSCSHTMHEIKERVYICPDTGGPYSHRRAKYFGPYSNKTVSTIYEIEALVSIAPAKSGYEIKWNNGKENEKELKKKAEEKLRLFDYRLKENEETPMQVFLLTNPAETNFFKSTSGGMMQSKKYFWDIASDCSNSDQLAAKLKNVAWEKAYEY